MAEHQTMGKWTFLQYGYHIIHVLLIYRDGDLINFNQEVMEVCEDNGNNDNYDHVQRLGQAVVVAPLAEQLNPYNLPVRRFFIEVSQMELEMMFDGAQITWVLLQCVICWFTQMTHCNIFNSVRNDGDGHADDEPIIGHGRRLREAMDVEEADYVFLGREA